MIKTLMPDTTQHHSFDMIENFSSSAGGMVQQALNHAMSETEADDSVNLKDRNKYATKVLFYKDTFELK